MDVGHFKLLSGRIVLVAFADDGEFDSLDGGEQLADCLAHDVPAGDRFGVGEPEPNTRVEVAVDVKGIGSTAHVPAQCGGNSWHGVLP